MSVDFIAVLRDNLPEIRRTLLAALEIVEKLMGISPRTSEIRREWREKKKP